VAQKLHEGTWIAANKLCWQSVQNQQQGAQEPEGGPHFKNTVLDVCSNQGAKPEISNAGAGYHWPPRWRPPCAKSMPYCVGKL